MAFTYKYNPLSKKFDIVQDTTLLTLKGVVDTIANLPLSGNSENDLYVVKFDDSLYTWNKAISTGILTDWINVGSVSSIDWSIITDKPTSTVGDIDSAVFFKHSNSLDHTQDTDTILTTDGVTPLFAVGLLARNLVAVTSSGISIQIGEIRALDTQGLKLYDDGGNGMFVKDGGNVGFGTTIPGGVVGIKDGNTFLDRDISNNLIFTDINTGTKTLAELASDSNKLASVLNTNTAITIVQATHENRTLRASNASAITVTIDTSLAEGTKFNIVKWGAGDITIVGSSMTLRSKDSLTGITNQYSGVTVEILAGNEALIIGDLA